ncbi:hypothetical protein DVH24_038525 [Malus domestica]|uniref:Glycoside hydrolase family 3 N-terminal domain-containing protein n=1 Tax=Malus domestica TaxID=3750 RepID=A0A498K9R1_MALDO|nr:hypothetical protein DVH24_038525 [Malus domestica]
MAPLWDCISRGVSTVMASYSNWNGNATFRYFMVVFKLVSLTLKGGFFLLQGFVISDWEALDRLCKPRSSDYRFCISSVVDAGVDVVMVPFRYEQFVEDLVCLVEHGEISMSRIDDAVERILRVKFVADLFEHPFSTRSLLDIRLVWYCCALKKKLFLLCCKNKLIFAASRFHLFFIQNCENKLFLSHLSTKPVHSWLQGKFVEPTCLLHLKAQPSWKLSRRQFETI